MNKDTLFWIFTVIQSYVIYYAFSTLIATNRLITEYVYFSEVKGLDSLPEIMKTSLFFGGLLAISTIGIEYLIYSKLKR